MMGCFKSGTWQIMIGTERRLLGITGGYKCTREIEREGNQREMKWPAAIVLSAWHDTAMLLV